ncbi:hypothetical protein [Synechococcus sp. UW105]|jgi:hypothetical protein|uniref:hypothetical protein n=1 Tax=unclassified Synechococcus TaxID=2626047 RepID=UPI000E0E21B4|nr:hypothetical protein [Synechococcus sp. UW105]RZO09379.1 MAG: hypothetical protein EVB08_10665 [Synechococcus sp. MED-G135]
MDLALRDDSADPSVDLLVLIASAADVCRKPFRHAVVLLDDASAISDAPRLLTDLLESGDDLRLRIECRDPDGERCPDEDLELELYRSGQDLNLMLGWWNQPDRPLLWQGQHPVWMNADSGQRCSAPEDGAPLEALTRRLRALFMV